MIKKITTTMLFGLCTLMLSASLLSASEADSKERVAVGTRVEAVQANAEESANASEGKVEINPGIAKTVKKKGAKNAKNMFNAVHPGSFQYVESKSFFGGSVELTDGSNWDLAYSLSRWRSSDLFVITKNHSFYYWNYKFALTNQRTGESYPANLDLGPIAPVYGSPYTHWIEAIDYYNNIIYLEDHTAWYMSMSMFDKLTISQWAVGDVVIIGVNDDSDSFNYPNILINVATINCAAGYASF